MSHHPNNQLASGSGSGSSNSSGFKNGRIISGVFEGKPPSDYESAWSPTSPLDFRLFSSLGNPFGVSFSSRSIRKVKQKSWDSGKVGLSIVDSLDDPSRVVLPSTNSKNIIFGGGSLMGTGYPRFGRKPYLPNPMLDGFSAMFPKPVDVVELDSSNRFVAGNNIINNNNAGQVMMMKQSSGPGYGVVDSEVKFSEDYTCVTSHGPIPKTTHIYGDRVLETVERNVVKKGCCGNKKKESIFAIAPLEMTTPTDYNLPPPGDFMRICYFCDKKLVIGKEIYMYSGYRAYCSTECRLVDIQQEEKMMEEEVDCDEVDVEATSMSEDDDDEENMSKKKSSGVIFTVG